MFLKACDVKTDVKDGANCGFSGRLMELTVSIWIAETPGKVADLTEEVPKYGLLAGKRKTTAKEKLCLPREGRKEAEFNFIPDFGYYYTVHPSGRASIPTRRDLKSSTRIL